MRHLIALLMLLGLALPGRADQAGDFDYYLLVLSWTPNWCVSTGDARRDERCAATSAIGWGLHGLWPQYERGWPQFCRTTHRDPNRAETAAMGRFMGSSGLAWHQWRKHGRCSGLSAADYFLTAARALGKVTVPDIFDQLRKPVTLPAKVVEDAFLDVNPTMQRDMITVTCQGRAIQEVRICLTRDLRLRRCGADTIRDCTLPQAEMAPIR